AVCGRVAHPTHTLAPGALTVHARSLIVTCPHHCAVCRRVAHPTHTLAPGALAVHARASGIGLIVIDADDSAVSASVANAPHTFGLRAFPNDTNFTRICYLSAYCRHE